MTTTLLCLAVFIVIGILLNLAEHSRRKRKQARQEHGLAVLRAGLDLMAAVQQHRGMSIALLNGDATFRPKLMAKRLEIQNILNRIPSLIENTLELHPDRRSFAAILEQWNELVATSEGHAPETSFRQHTSLVRGIIHLMGDMGEHLGLLDGEGSTLARLSNALLLKLPLLLESIGQARALGSGYAAKGQCGAVGRIRLSFLEQRIRECFEGVHRASIENEAVSRKVDDFLLTLENRFIKTASVDIDPAVFFQTATDAIDSCLMLWREVAQHTSTAVMNRS